jgi:hypothetical protein
LQVRATAMTGLPRPLPSLAPSIIPGRSYHRQDRQGKTSMAPQETLKFAFVSMFVERTKKKNRERTDGIRTS